MRLQALAVAAATLLVLDAQAVEAEPRAYLVGGIGLSRADLGSKEASDAALAASYLAVFPAGTAELSSDDSGRTMSVGIGLRLNRHLLLEAAYRNFGEASAGYVLTEGANVDAQALNYKAAGAGASVLGSLPLTPTLSLYGRLDLVSLRTTTEAVYRQANSYSLSVPREHAALAVGYGLGLEYEVARRLSLRLDARRITGEFEGPGGFSSIDFDSVNIYVLKAF